MMQTCEEGGISSSQKSRDLSQFLHHRGNLGKYMPAKLNEGFKDKSQGASVSCQGQAELWSRDSRRLLLTKVEKVGTVSRGLAAVQP